MTRSSGCAAGALTTHTDDVLGCGKQDILLKVRKYLGRRFGYPAVQEQPLARVGTEVSQANDFSLRFTPGNFTDMLKHAPASSEM